MALSYNLVCVREHLRCNYAGGGSSELAEYEVSLRVKAGEIQADMLIGMRGQCGVVQKRSSVSDSVLRQ